MTKQTTIVIGALRVNTDNEDQTDCINVQANLSLHWGYFCESGVYLLVTHTLTITYSISVHFKKLFRKVKKYLIANMSIADQIHLHICAVQSRSILILVQMLQDQTFFIYNISKSMLNSLHSRLGPV